MAPSVKLLGGPVAPLAPTPPQFLLHWHDECVCGHARVLCMALYA